MSVERKSSTPVLLTNLRVAQAKGLIAAANVLKNEVKRNLRHGYLSSLGNWGDWVTGNNVNHVTASDPIFTSDGGSIKVGTDLDYALWWEIGHHNIFTRHYERDPRWVPAYQTTRQQVLDTYARVFSATWRSVAPVGFYSEATLD
jgi:hypothetical protein